MTATLERAASVAHDRCIPRPCDYARLAKQAKALAGGVGKYDSQPWIPTADTRPAVPTPAERAARRTEHKVEVRPGKWITYTTVPRTTGTPTRGGSLSLFDPVASGMSRLAMYQHQLFPDIHIGKLPRDCEADLLPSQRPRSRWAANPEVWSKKYIPGGDPADTLGGDDDIAPRVRPELRGGKRAPDGGPVDMPPGSWHVADGAKWSTAFDVCLICRNNLDHKQAERKYCSAVCRREGSNATRRAKRKVKWPTDEHGWYIQQPFPQRRRRLKVHTFTEWEMAQTQTISGDYRLRPPWHGKGQLRAWKVAKVTA